MGAPVGTGLERNYKEADETYHRRGEYKGGVMLPEYHKKAGQATSGLPYDPHTPVPQNVIEYEDDGVTIKSTTVIGPKEIAAITAHNTAKVTRSAAGPKGETTYRYEQTATPLSFVAAAAIAAAPAAPAAPEPMPPVQGQDIPDEMRATPPQEPPRFRNAGEFEREFEHERENPRSLPTEPPTAVFPAKMRTLKQVQISNLLGKFSIRCVDAFISDIYLVLVQNEDEGGVFEPNIDPDIEQTIMFGGRRYPCRTLTHYKMPDGKTAHSVYLLIPTGE